MNFLLVALLIVLFSLQSLFCKQQAAAYPGEPTLASGAFSVGYGLLITLFTLLLAGGAFHPSPVTIGLGLCNAAVLFCYNLSLLAATARGSYSTTMIVLLFGGILVPLFVSLCFLNGHITPVEWAAIAGMLLSFLLLTGRAPHSEGAPAAMKPIFLLLCAALFVTNGLYGTILDIQQTATHGAERTDLLIVTYGGSALLALGYLAVRCRFRAGRLLSAFRQSKKSTLFLLLGAVTATAAHNLLLVCLGRMNAAVLYALDNGGVMLLSILYSSVFFHERPSRRQLGGMALAFAALIALSVG